MAGPKVVVIGAGSFCFGRCVIYNMATSPIMAGGTLALVDTNPHALKTMMRLARRVFAHTKCRVKLIGHTDRRQVIKDADFVVLSFSEKNAHYRGLDTRIAARHGMRMCSGDTIGPGGIFRALREVPHALAIARDVARRAPRAWIINYVNPTAVLGIALRRYAPDVNSFAICDGHHEPHDTLMWCRNVGILPASATAVPPEVANKLDLAIGGVNHCTWLVRFNYDGKDMLPRWRRELVQLAREEKKAPESESKARFNYNYALQLFDLYGAYPTAVSHTKEYVPFFQTCGVRPIRPEPIRLFDADQRAREMAQAWQVTEQYAAGKLSVRHFLKHTAGDHATDIIESMWGGLGKSFYINSCNNSAVSNLPPDAFLELRSHVDMNGPRPLPFGAFPRGLLALQCQVWETHELTAEAAVTGDRALLRRALLTDPLCHNIPDADACIKELLETERTGLPRYWFKSRR